MRLEIFEAPEGLSNKILLSIQMAKQKLAKKRLVIFGITSFASAGGLIYAVFSLFKSFGESGFYQYLSLLFSENTGLLSYWKELSYTLAESLPIMGLMIFLASLGFLVWSLSKIKLNNLNRSYA